eukprot:399416-Alexandrium_andersonii.AAC.1
MLKLKKTARLHYEGTSFGDTFMPVVLPGWKEDESWCIRFGDKKRIYGHPMGATLAFERSRDLIERS